MIDKTMTDSEMLDWLERAARKSRSGISFDWVPACEGEPSGFRFMRRHLIGDQSDTLRKAIMGAAYETEIREEKENAK